MSGKAIFKIGLISLAADLFRTVDAFRAASKDLFENLFLALFLKSLVWNGMDGYRRKRVPPRKPINC
jgi:hypothetical protein